MVRKRSSFSPEFKMQVVLEALQTNLTLGALAEKHQISVKNITNWKQQFLENAHLAFENLSTKDALEPLKKENEKLEKLISQAKVECDFVTRKVKELKL
jgi:putative transposase